MEWKKSLIKKSLLKENRHLDALAIQLFKNLMSYMGDRKSSPRAVRSTARRSSSSASPRPPASATRCTCSS